MSQQAGTQKLKRMMKNQTINMIRQTMSKRYPGRWTGLLYLALKGLYKVYRGDTKIIDFLDAFG